MLKYVYCLSTTVELIFKIMIGIPVYCKIAQCISTQKTYKYWFMIILMRVLQFFSYKIFFSRKRFFRVEICTLIWFGSFEYTSTYAFSAGSLTYILLTLYKFSQCSFGSSRRIDISQKCYFIAIVLTFIFKFQ